MANEQISCAIKACDVSLPVLVLLELECGLGCFIILQDCFSDSDFYQAYSYKPILHARNLA